MKVLTGRGISFLSVAIAAGIYLLVLISTASALTDAERMQLLEDRFLRGEIPSKLYLELREKYKQRLKTTDKPVSVEETTLVESADWIEPGPFSYGCWIEAETASQTNLREDTSREKFDYIQGKGLGMFAKKLPAEGNYYAEYEFELPERDEYTLWFRGSYLNLTRLRSTFSWKVDNKPFTDATGLPYVDKGHLVWSKLGTVKLDKGKHTLRIETKEEHSCTQYGYHMFLDVFAFVSKTKSTWLPSSKIRPPLVASREGPGIFKHFWEGKHLAVSGEITAGWSTIYLDYKGKETFAKLPERLSLLIKANEPSQIKPYLVMADPQGMKTSFLVTRQLGYGGEYRIISPQKRIEESQDPSKSDHCHQDAPEIKYPLTFKGIELVFRKPGNYKIEIDNLFADDRLLEDFSTLDKWELGEGSVVENGKLALVTDGKEGGRFYSNKKYIYLASDVPARINIEYQGYFQKVPKDLRLQIDLPEGVEIANKLAANKSDMSRTKRFFIVPKGTVKHNGSQYNRFQVSTILFAEGVKEETYPRINLMLQTNLPAGARREVYYKTLWEGGASKEEKKEAVVMEVHKVSPPKRLFTGVMRSSGCRHAPLDYYWNLGLKALLGNSRIDSLLREYKQHGYILGIGLSPYTLGNEKDELDKLTARDIAGDKPVEQLIYCHSYGGKYFQSTIERGKSRAVQGATVFSIVSEQFLGAAKYCYCSRCLEKYQQFMAEKYADMTYKDPRVFEKDWRKYPKYHDTWWDFKMAQAADLLRTIVEEVGKEVRKYGGEPQFFFDQDIHYFGPPDNLYLDPNTGKPYAWNAYFDYGRLGKFMNICHQVNVRRGYNETFSGDETLFVRQQMGKDTPHIFVGIFMGPYSAFWQRMGNVWGTTHLKTVKSQLLEFFANGAKGAWLLEEGSVNGLEEQCIAEAIRIVNQVEDIIMDGAPMGEDVFKVVKGDSVRIRGMNKGDEYFIIVADYSGKPVEAEIEFKGKCPVQVIDLDTGAKAARLTGRKKTFRVRIESKDGRVRSFYVGNKNPSEAGLR